MTDIDKHHIENYGLNTTGGVPSNRPNAEERHKWYMAHLERLKWDEDYRYKWEQNEREWMEKQKRNYYY